MNKQLIKALDEQANQFATQQCPDFQGISRVFSEKFAELIVKECVANLRNTKKVELPFLTAVNENATELPLSVYIVLLKEHFGVE